MNVLALIAVVIVCVTAIAVHVANLHHQRERQRDLVRERQEDDRLEKVSQRLHAERMAQNDRQMELWLSRASAAFSTLELVTEQANRAEAAGVDVKDIVKALDTNFGAIESRLVSIETGLGWTKRPEGM